jgi:predicted nuclease of predicted toxin-antitoxin system
LPPPIPAVTIRDMRWLLHGNLTAAVGEALRRHGHTADSSEKLGIDATNPSELLKSANTKQLDIITADSELADAPFTNGSRFDRSIVFLQVEGGDVEQDDAIDRLFKRYKRLTPRRLYTVTGSRVKIRQLPQGVIHDKVKG